MLSLKIAAAGAMSVIMVCSTVGMAQPQRPQQGKDDPRFNQTQPVQKVDAQPVARANIDDVARMLKGLGYQVNLNKANNGHVILELDINVKGKVVPVDIELSKDGCKIWLTSWFKQLGQGESIPASFLTQMLESNGTLGPVHFSISQSKQLYLAGPMDNRNVSPEDLRRELDIFTQVYMQTEPLWNHNNWKNAR